MRAKPFEAAIFDLDGVIADTAKFHYKAWKRLAGELGFAFSERENEQLEPVFLISHIGVANHTGAEDGLNE
ncbi:HAD hydrolase-like protein [Paenibacillus sp. FSL M7-1046]|uniref:HAD hydrolase-like protein n=1 Tax=Paenibacillus sp. FSL M7-1046 TaxID=2975315 RepID=UPI0030F9D481